MVITLIIGMVVLIAFCRNLKKECRGVGSWIFGTLTALFYTGIISGAYFAGALALGEMFETSWEIKERYDLVNLPKDETGIYFVSNDTGKGLLTTYKKMYKKIEPAQFSSSGNVVIKEDRENQHAEVLTYRTTFSNKYHFIYAYPIVSIKHEIHIPVGGVKKI